jgi:hypothetical protein
MNVSKKPVRPIPCSYMIELDQHEIQDLLSIIARYPWNEPGATGTSWTFACNLHKELTKTISS